MFGPSPVLLSILGGVAIAIQNAIMLAVMNRGVGFTGALVVNSAVGLSLLAAVEIFRSGPSFVFDIAAQARPWFVLPGLLGTFYVFAGLYGYRRQGAAATIVLVVAAQLAMGIGLDAFGMTGSPRMLGARTAVGATLLIIGAALVVRGS